MSGHVHTASATPSPPPACCLAWSGRGRRWASAEWQECGRHAGAAGGSPWLPHGPASRGPLHCGPAQIPVRGLGLRKALFPWTCASLRLCLRPASFRPWGRTRPRSALVPAVPLGLGLPPSALCASPAVW